jgi:hypothetical protein
VAYYWCSIVNSHAKNDAQWMADRFTSVFRTLLDTHHLRITGLVVDNESVNKATYNLLVVRFPFLLHVPCAAHTVQLAVRSCLALPTFADTVAQLTDLIRFFDSKDNRNALKQQQVLRGARPLVVIKPNDTRWSSTLRAAERMLLIRREVECCVEDCSVPSIESKEDFFKALSVLCDFLKPFQVATDLIQSDVATLFTVYTQFGTLLTHTTSFGSVDATKALLSRWERRLNVPATIACAILSFANLPDALIARSKEARDFIRDFGSQYLVFYKISGSKSVRDVRDELTVQLAQFTARQGVFVTLDEDIATIARQPGPFNPRLVWSLYAEAALARVATVLLSVSPSEAAVERTFSAQKAVHSDHRNRLHGDTIESEMFLKFNHRTMLPRERQPDDGVVEMDENYDAELYPPLPPDLFDIPVDIDEAASTDEEPPEIDDADAMEIEDWNHEPASSAAAPASAGARRRARREPSVVHTSLNDFIAWFIAEHNITAGTVWNADLRNSLTRFSSRIPPPVPNVKSIEDSIRAAAH